MPTKLVSEEPDPAARWYLVALALCTAAVAATVTIVLRSDQDPASVRWPLVAVPLIAALAAVRWPARPARITAAVVLVGFVLLGAASVGLLFVPAAVAAAVGAGRSHGAR